VTSFYAHRGDHCVRCNREALAMTTPCRELAPHGSPSWSAAYTGGVLPSLAVLGHRGTSVPLRRFGLVLYVSTVAVGGLTRERW
jgi:hypothetical protein